jgi:hypothetical protein
MKIKLSAIIPVLTFLLIAVSSSHANDTRPAQEESIQAIKEVAFMGFHDNPGRMTLKDKEGNEWDGTHFYRFIPYDDDFVNTWQEGEKVTISYSDQKGLGIVREEDGKFYKLFFYPDEESVHPYILLSNKCRAEVQSTIQFTICSHKDMSFWKLEQQYLIESLKQEEPEPFKTAVQQDQENWEQYVEGVRNAHKVCALEDLCYGTRHETRFSEQLENMQKNRAVSIASLLENM